MTTVQLSWRPYRRKNMLCSCQIQTSSAKQQAKDGNCRMSAMSAS